MNLLEAKEYVKKVFAIDLENTFIPDYLAIIRIRHQNTILPEYGVDGSERDQSEWAFIDMTENIDTRLYGAVYYFGHKNNGGMTNSEKFKEVFGWEPSTEEPLPAWWANDKYIAEGKK